MNKLGKFEINSGVVVVSDPCYTLNSVGEVLENVKTGTWVGGYESNGHENEELIAYHEDNGQPRDWEWSHHSNEICVDSGQAGIYDKDYYRNDELAENKEKADFGDNYDTEDGDVWYRYNCYQTLETADKAGVIDNGIVSSSGYGDGCYDLFVAISDGQIVGLKVVFIGGDVCEDCGEREDDCCCEYCDECGEKTDYCYCTFCDECGEHERYCECEYCDDCGEHERYCECEDEKDKD